ncbi:beta-1,4-glucuronyltransferase 1-like [Cylas formicarius]|uniref:beta-1,4-glucuronyltransferase 1-like n=1 Tax=Cylas formicarius TaxID=197179 RepID=UPI002958CD9E|nr:beta-1,4-glucuronyltransferase 1-like [Cylas formicarius]XP_060524607.1 beta-1,4-glucuronyltransferase 1-like [Cylas formicarius]XP_060524608.1 beta-1,4-glucuronyltransferase 1-like [Cylas formicarius]
MYNNRKSLIIKVLIIVCLIYFAIHIITNSAPTVIRELQQSGRSLAALDTQSLEQTSLVQEIAVPTTVNITKTSTSAASRASEDVRRVLTVFEKVKEVTQCLDRSVVPKTQQRGDYWVLYNYVTAQRTFKCEESVTYTTHADYSFMDNLVPLLERWRAPISIALHAPGSDFANTLESIAHLRDCTTSLVKEYVTFHIYFSTKHVPKEVPKHNHVFEEPYNCSLTPPYLNVSSDQMYKAQKNLLYPVNVGRNVAREMAQTYYVLASDIELYPSPNISTKFLDMIATNTGPLLSKNPKVYPLHIFEVSANAAVPETKNMLKEMLGNGTALPFHKKLCPGCHSVPKAKEWQTANETEGLHVFHVGKRIGSFVHWEPIYIGTHFDPLYDERLSWEGKSDKMTQGYALCVLDYDFLILDNAFLVHKPGIKVYKQDPKRSMLAAKTNQLIKKIIFPELKVLYGIKKGCAV